MGMGCRKWLGPILFALGALLAALAMVSTVSADPDPPVIDGGVTTFQGDWVVDFGDRLAYLNQTIVLDGNLSVEDNGTLDLVNCTLVLNCTFTGEFGIEVLPGGTLNVTGGSQLTQGSAGMAWHGIVSREGHLLLSDSQVRGVGYVYFLPDRRALFSAANDTVVLRSEFVGGNGGLVLDAVDGAVVRDTSFTGPSRVGLEVTGGSVAVRAEDLTFVGVDTAVSVTDCQGLLLANLSVTGGGYGLSIDNSSVTLSNSAFIDVLGDVAMYRNAGRLGWWADSTAGLVNCTLPLNGSLEVRTGGAVSVHNSTLAIMNPIASGTNGINVLSGGSLVVTNGSVVAKHVPGLSFHFEVLEGGHLTLDHASVQGVGWDGGRPGLVLWSSGNVVNSSSISGSPVGLSVRGDGNRLSNVTISSCTYGISWKGSNSTGDGLAIDSCSASGILMEAVANVSVTRTNINHQGSMAAIVMTNCSDIRLEHIVVAGTPLVALSIDTCSNVSMVDVNATAILTAIALDGGGVSANVSVQGAVIDAAGTSIHAQGISGVVLEGIRSTNCSGTGILIVGVMDILVTDCHLEGSGTGLNLSQCEDVRIRDVRTRSPVAGIELGMVSVFSVANCFLTDGGPGISLRDCIDGELIAVTTTNATFGFTLDGSSRINLTDCTVDQALEAFILQQGTDNCTVTSTVIVSTWRAMRVLGPGTMDNLVRDLTLLNVSNGFMFVGVGPNNTVANCSFVGMEYVMSVMSGQVDVVDCSFIACEHPLWCDTSSWVTVKVTDGSLMVAANYSLMTGEFLVMAGGELNISSSEVRFQSGDGRASGIRTEAGSDLWISNGSRIEWLAGYSPGTINVSGDLLLRDSVIVGGGLPGGPAAVTVLGDSALIINVTFSDCQSALTLAGRFHLVQECVFIDNRQSILFDGVAGARVSNSHFGPNDDLWDLQGSFSTSLVVDNCTFEGAGRVATAIFLTSVHGETSSLTLRNLTLSNYTNWGIEDLHEGHLLISDCQLHGANLSVGEFVGGGLSLARLHVVDSLVSVGVNGFTISDCDFVNSSLKVSNNSEGSLVTDCSFTGGMSPGSACLEVDGSLSVTLVDITISDAPVGLRLFDGSDVTVLDLIVQSTSVAAVEVNRSIVRMEGCTLTGLSGSGIRSWNMGSRVEFRNGTISATLGRSGLDVDARDGGDVWLLNTVFNTSSVDSSFDGRVEVAWLVTVEPILPWGGTLWELESLTVTDATGIEVVNTTHADTQMRLYQFFDVDGKRTMHTPHSFCVNDNMLGVSYSDEHTIDASVHIVLYLVDVASPVARGGPDQVVDEDTIVTLNATGSSDNDPTFPQAGTYRWTFDEYGAQVVLQDAVARYVFSVPGKYWINLTVTDAACNVGHDTVIVQVRDRTPPVIIFNGNMTVTEDDEHFFDASASTDNDPSFDAENGTFKWEITLGEELLERETASFYYAFPDPGFYNGVLRVWDHTGNVVREEFWVHVMDVTPPVIVGMNDALVFEPASGLLDASACSDNVGILSYNWTVTYEFEPASPVLLQGVTPSFTFDRLGTYLVQLTLLDAAGNSNSTTSKVVLDDVPYISTFDWAVTMVGERFSVPVNVSDVYFDVLLVHVVTGPEGASIEGAATSSRLVWTPGEDVMGQEVVIGVEVYDGFTSSQTTITVHVNPARGSANRAPSIISDPPRDSKRDTPYVYKVVAEDADGDVLWYMLTKGPEGMSISQGGTVTWDPSFDHGTILVDVQVNVTDGRAMTVQSWTLRWREPPNRAPSISFQIPPLEVRVHESFQVDLSVFVQDPQAYDVDEDDPNFALLWDVVLDETVLTLVQRDGMVFYLRSLDVPGTTVVNFTVVDPSGAMDVVGMDVAVQEPTPVDEDEVEWLPWLVLLVVIAVILAVAVVARYRRGPTEVPGAGEETGVTTPGPPGTAAQVARRTPSIGAGEEALGEADAFVELEGTPSIADAEPARGEAPSSPRVSRVIDREQTAPKRVFQLEGVALSDGSGSMFASTGPVDDAFGPFAEALEKVRSDLNGDGIAVLELDGRRALVVEKWPFGALCLVRGREDVSFRERTLAILEGLADTGSRDAPQAAIEDIISIAGAGATAEVVHDAWTSRLVAELSYVGSMVLMEVKVRNDTDHILNNMKLTLEYDQDALRLESVEPKLLTSRGVFALGNVPPRKKRKARYTFMPELCLSSTIRVMGTYTDSEGMPVYVPSRGLPVRVECPYIESGAHVDEGRVLAMAEEGLGHKGLRVLTHGIDVDHLDLFRLAVGVVSEKGPMKVIDLEDDTLMRAEAWFLGAGQGGAPQVLVRVSSHGADRLMELFVTSDDGATTAGLLTHLMVEVMDRAASQMPGKRVERVRDASTLEEIEVWPTLLDYKVMGE